MTLPWTLDQVRPGELSLYFGYQSTEGEPKGDRDPPRHDHGGGFLAALDEPNVRPVDVRSFS